MNLKLDEESKSIIEDVSALSGIQKDIVREVWELTLYRWLETITRNPKGLNQITIPFLGNVGVRYLGDVRAEDGTFSANVESFIGLSDKFKALVGDIYSENTLVLSSLLEDKIKQAINSASKG